MVISALPRTRFAFGVLRLVDKYPENQVPERFAREEE
jgi:hypothetical protein